jgi:hypothetical protein
MSLKRNLIDKVYAGRQPFTLLISTATGTGIGTATYRIGQCCLDRSSKNWFLCTATTGTGTWVAINA